MRLLTRDDGWVHVYVANAWQELQVSNSLLSRLLDELMARGEAVQQVRGACK